MIHWIDSFLSFFADQTRRISTKLAIGISFLILLWLVDNTFGFSYYYSTSNKISQISKLQDLLDNPKLDSSLKLRLASLQIDVLNRRSFGDYLRFSVRNIFATNSNNTQNAKPIDGNPIKNSLLFKLSACGIYLIFLLLSILILFPIGRDIFKNAALIVMLDMIILGISIFLIQGLKTIPVLFNNIVFNYILNFLIQILSIYLLAKMFVYIKKSEDGKI